MVGVLVSKALDGTARGPPPTYHRPIPLRKRPFRSHFDFINHALEIQTSIGDTRTFHLVTRTSPLLEEFMAALQLLGINVKVWDMP